MPCQNHAAICNAATHLIFCWHRVKASGQFVGQEQPQKKKKSTGFGEGLTVRESKKERPGHGCFAEIRELFVHFALQVQQDATGSSCHLRHWKRAGAIDAAPVDSQ
ncbi:unnamed protein product [Symbiodinium natans]|uniref:Uncharacterized protein n=1 Tax=Symbiodinium natans TaxID=878477 RepID=A0A812N363_9DINO|nr:unnamed protein product [Symbiodinium natans]